MPIADVRAILDQHLAYLRQANLRSVLLDEPRLAQPSVSAALLAGELDHLEGELSEREGLAGHVPIRTDREAIPIEHSRASRHFSGLFSEEP